MITHRLGLSRWEEGFEAMANKEAIKVILTYDLTEAERTGRNEEYGSDFGYAWSHED